MIGRFPIYTNEVFKDQEEKWHYVLKLIRDIDEAVYRFLLEAPDGTLRVVGPVQTRNGNCLILCSPLPVLFRFLVLNLPSITKATVKPDETFVEITTVKKLFRPPSIYTLKIFDASSMSFKKLTEEFWEFLGVKIEPRYLFKSFKIGGKHTYITVKTLNSDASALINFSRYIGFGENRKLGFGDVEIFEITEY